MKASAKRSCLTKGKFMTTFGAFNHITVNKGRAARAGKNPAIRYIEGKPAFGTTQYMFPFRAQCWNSLTKSHSIPIKTFPIYSLKSNLRINDEILFRQMWG